MSPWCRKVFHAAAAGSFALGIAIHFGSAETVSAPPAKVAKTTLQFSDVRLTADFKDATFTADVRIVADWMLRNNKHESGPFIIADKAGGVMYAFDRAGVLIAKSPALYGKTRSDSLTEKQAAMSISEVTNADKVTPAGLFRAKGADTVYGKGVVFAEYARTRLTIHQVFLGNKAEGRQGRMQSESLADHRVTFGCINAPAEFISRVVVPYFGGESVIAVLPETQSAVSFFGIEDGVVEVLIAGNAVGAGRLAATHHRSN